MAYSNTLETSLKKVINYSEKLPPELLLAELNNVPFKTILRVSAHDGIFEVPLIVRKSLEGIINQNLISVQHSNDYILDTLYPLCSESIIIQRKTFDTIIKLFFLDSGWELRKIRLNDGSIYYGNRGIILDANFNPILLITLKAELVDNVCKYKNIVIHISPSVFTNQTLLINKGIIKKIIPFYIENKFYNPIVNNFYDSGYFLDKTEFVIDSFDDFIYNPIKPSPSFCTNESMNQCILDHVHNILDNLE